MQLKNEKGRIQNNADLCCDCYDLKQHVFRYMLIVIKILKMYSKVKYYKLNKESY
jgi:hypothetical protein